MYLCFYSNHWFSAIVAVFGADGDGCGVFIAFSCFDLFEINSLYFKSINQSCSCIKFETSIYKCPNIGTK